MNTQVNRTPLAISAWLHVQRAREAVNMAAAELPRTQLSPQARQQYALELAELMGKVELLLSMLRRQASNDPRVRRRNKRLASGFRLGLAKACAFTLKSASELGGLGLLKVLSGSSWTGSDAVRAWPAPGSATHTEPLAALTAPGGAGSQIRHPEQPGMGNYFRTRPGNAPATASDPRQASSRNASRRDHVMGVMLVHPGRPDPGRQGRKGARRIDGTAYHRPRCHQPRQQVHA